VPVDTKGLDRALESIRRSYGEGAVHTGEKTTPVPRISTGSASLDWATSGGIPIGRWSHFYGGYSSCKTLTCWNVVREALDMGQTVAYYNIEKQFDKEWLQKRGIDTKKVLVVEGTTIEGVGDKLEVLLGSVHLHIIDSLAAAVSQDELAGETGDWFPGLPARAWGKVIRRANERFDDNENTVILVNQTRDVFGARGAEAPTGGKSIEYISSMSLRFRRGSWLFRDDNGMLKPNATAGDSLSGDKEPEGMEFQARVEKSRCGPPLRAARLRLDFDGAEFDEAWELTQAAVFFGVVDKAHGGRYTLPGGKKVHGEAKLRQEIESDHNLIQLIRSKMRNNP